MKRDTLLPPPRRLHPDTCDCGRCTWPGPRYRGPSNRLLGRRPAMTSLAAPCEGGLSWPRRIGLFVAGAGLAQLIILAIDPIIGGPGPFAWLALIPGFAS